jgi:hypothetical protein
MSTLNRRKTDKKSNKKSFTFLHALSLLAPIYLSTKFVDKRVDYPWGSFLLEIHPKKNKSFLSRLVASTYCIYWFKMNYKQTYHQ